MVFTFGRIFIRLTQILIIQIRENNFDYEFFGFYLFQLILLPAVGTTVVNYFQEFTITWEGIEFQVFIFWRILVSWSEIISIKGSLWSRGTSYVIVTERLTFLHRVIGLIYGRTFKPAFIFNHYLNGYDEAIKTIQEKLNQNQ
jgi:hypothetical protein